MRPTPSDAAIMQARSLGPRLSPPASPGNIPLPVAYIAVDDSGRDILTVEGPVEIEPDTGVHQRLGLPLEVYDWGDVG